MAAIKKGEEGEGMVRQLLKAKADVNLKTEVISLSTWKGCSPSNSNSRTCAA